MGAFLLPAIPYRCRVGASSCEPRQTAVCLTHQLSRGHDQTIDVEAAQLTFGHAFDTRAIGGLQQIQQRGEPRQRATE